MIAQEMFKNAQRVQDWMSKYYQSLENLRNLKAASPGVTPTEVVAQVDQVKLLKFKSGVKPVHKTPILISYALVNRFTIADLQEGKSLVQKLLEGGAEVYVVDWGYPTPADRYTDLDDYINFYLDFCVDAILKKHGIDRLNLLGICQGGAFSVIYSALHPEKINRLITMVTPINFKTEKDILSHMIQNVDIAKYVKAYGNISGQSLNTNFNMLQPISLNLKKWIDSVDSLSDTRFASFFLNMESWINDSPDQAGAAYCEFVQKFYQQNQLVNGTLELGGRRVDLKNITMPVLNVYGAYDHLVPPEASRALGKLVGSREYSEMEIGTGHIGMYVSGKAQEVPGKILAWLKG